jgi:uncharacterized protein YndB with AHSA1/START domain
MDVAHEINSVSRTVGSRTLAAGTARTVRLTRVYDAEIVEVWKACTQSQLLQRWFLPVSGDLRLGGRFEIEGNASGTIERCDPPRSFSTTWELGGEVSWVEVRLSKMGREGTQLELEHIAHVDEARWKEFGPGAVGVGWDLTLAGLGRLLLQPDKPVEASEAAAWPASDEGKDFLRRSSLRWHDANVAAGADGEEAESAARQTTAFYIG